jgi:7-cyano-7-deazaguanine reductase
MEFARKDVQPGILIQDTSAQLDTPERYKLLETFDFASRHPQLIHIHTTEFSAVCPGTGLPDIGTLDIEYIPAQKAVELKALKYYLFSFRNEGIFQEPVTDLIFAHLWKCMEPRYLKVTMKYNTRGGFDTTTVQERGNRAIANPDAVQRV